MDRRCVRVLKEYPNGGCQDGYIYVDARAQEMLNAGWGDDIWVKGSGETVLKLAKLHDEDTDAFIARATQATLDLLLCEVGDDVLLYPPSEIPKRLKK